MQLIKSETRLLRELAGEVQDEYYNGDVSCTPDVLLRTRGRTNRAKPLRLSCDTRGCLTEHAPCQVTFSWISKSRGAV